jgi:hypothetical protein
MVQTQAIGPADLYQIEEVLSGRTSLHTAAVEFSQRLSALLGITILYLAGWDQSTEKGEYGQLLDALCQEPGKPEGGWPKDVPYPEWYNKKANHYLMHASRRNGWHKSPGGVRGPQVLNPPPEIKPFAQNPDYRRRATEFLERVRLGRRAELPTPLSATPEASTDFRVIQAVLAGYPEVGGLAAQLIKNCSTADQFVAAVTALGLTVRRYLPEQPTP